MWSLWYVYSPALCLVHFHLHPIINALTALAKQNDGGMRPSILDYSSTDDVLPAKRMKSSNRQLNIARFYPIHKISSLSAPYQQPIEANRPVHLYVWQMPSPANVAYLIKVGANYFQHTDQTIGLLFSRPISRHGLSTKGLSRSVITWPERLPAELHQQGATSCLDYARFKHGTRASPGGRSHEVWIPPTPLVALTRISRHQERRQ
ncbi:hypothetical protein TcWFU_006345, partial [Taenia crassiceps]